MKNKKTIEALEQKIKDLGLSDEALAREVGEWTMDKSKLPLFDMENVELTEEGINHFLTKYKDINAETKTRVKRLAVARLKRSALKPFHKLFRRTILNAAEGKDTATIYVRGKERRKAVVDMCSQVGMNAEVDGWFIHTRQGEAAPYPFKGYLSWTWCVIFVSAVGTMFGLVF